MPTHWLALSLTCALLAWVTGCVDQAGAGLVDGGVVDGAADDPADAALPVRDSRPADRPDLSGDVGTPEPPDVDVVDVGGPQLDFGGPEPDLGDDDPGPAPPCALQAGVCSGARQPWGGAAWVPCDEASYRQHAPTYAEWETGQHCDGLDNDCDGQIDEDCLCLPDETRSCGSDVGECRAGQQRCQAGRWSPCDARGPAPEVCDGLDNDCDGGVDPGCDCIHGQTRTCGNDVGECQRGEQTCVSGTWGACSGREPVAEQCNGRDDDCDTRVDEDSPCPEDHQCLQGACQRVRWVFETESGAMGHEVGRREAEGWSASTGPDGRGLLVFGPYFADLPPGDYDLRFRLMTDNVEADNGSVVRLEVNDFDRHAGTCGDCVIASRSVRRREFQAPMRYQDFPLRFTNPVGHRLEFRTYWHDIAYVRQDRVEAVRAH